MKEICVSLDTLMTILMISPPASLSIYSTTRQATIPTTNPMTSPTTSPKTSPTTSPTATLSVSLTGIFFLGAGGAPGGEWTKDDGRGLITMVVLLSNHKAAKLYDTAKYGDVFTTRSFVKNTNTVLRA